MEKELQAYEKYFGFDHPQTGKVLMNLGNAYGSLGDYEMKKKLLERALNIFEKHFGPEHPSIGATLVNLSNAYGSLGDY